MKHALKHIHFVGVGGSGMSGIAEVLHDLGYTVSGSDAAEGETTRHLAQRGLRVAVGHDARHVAGADAVVASTAIRADNPELRAARDAGIPVVPRAVMLAELMRHRQGIAIAGTHGKTTTTSLVASVLAECGLDPTFVIGGKLQSAGTHARLGRGEYIVVEADESDASFLHLLPVLAVVTNVDEDHMDTYGHDVSRLDQAFIDFLHRLPFYGAAVVCADDPGVQRLLPRVQRPLVRYGLAEGASPRAVDVQALGGGRMRFTAQRAGLPDLPVTLNLAGLHNVRNALAAIAVADELELPAEATARALANFGGVGRRFQRWGELPAAGGGAYTLIDDYGHHPVEMQAVLDAARGAFPGRRLVLAFQPHRYTRTRDCFDAFVAVLKQADAVLLADVYPAGEPPIDGATSAALAQAAGLPTPCAIGAMPSAIAAAARDRDVVITMGAGTIGQVPARLRESTGGPA